MKEIHMNSKHGNYRMKMMIFLAFKQFKKCLTSWETLRQVATFDRCFKKHFVRKSRLNQCPIWQDQSYIKQDVGPFVITGNTSQENSSAWPNQVQPVWIEGHMVTEFDLMIPSRNDKSLCGDGQNWPDDLRNVTRADRLIKLVYLPVELHVNHGLSLTRAASPWDPSS